MGSAYGTAKSGIGIASMGVLKPDMIMKSIVPIIMAGILGIYGLIVSVILLQRSKFVIFSHHLLYSRHKLHSCNGLQAFGSRYLLWFLRLGIFHFKILLIII